MTRWCAARPSCSAKPASQRLTERARTRGDHGGLSILDGHVLQLHEVATGVVQNCELAQGMSVNAGFAFGSSTSSTSGLPAGG